MRDRLFPAVLVCLVSASILAVEILFVRLLAAVFWQSYLSLVVSLALLGFGVSGTLLACFRAHAQRHLADWTLWALASYIVSLCAVLLLFHLVPFNPFALGWNVRQWFYLALHFLMLLPAFTCGPLIVALQFLGRQSVNRLYGLSFVGCALGALITLSLLGFLSPAHTMLAWLILLCLPFMLWPLFGGGRRAATAALIVCLPAVAFVSMQVQRLHPSEYKGIAYALAVPRARVEYERHSVMGTAQVVSAPGLRQAHGLSYSFMGHVPEQKLLFIDGDAGSAVVPYAGNKDTVEYLGYTVSALPYALREHPEVLLVDAGGGEDLLRACLHSAARVTALEANPAVIALMTGPLAAYSGRIYQQANGEVVNQSARFFLSQRTTRFDIIALGLADSFTAASGGVMSVNETYLYTLESFALMYDHLRPGGVLAVTCWLKTPPRASLRLFASLAAMLRSKGRDPGTHLAFVRSANTACLCASNQPIDSALIRRFCRDKGFDVAYCSGITSAAANRLYRYHAPVFYQACRSILRNGDAFLAGHVFDLAPVRDNSPYFHHYFRFRTLGIIGQSGLRLIAFNELGYGMLLVLLLALAVCSFCLVLLPLGLATVRVKLFAPLPLRVLLFCACVGTAYFFVEMALIQSFALVLQYPVYSLAFCTAVLLLASGAGAMLAGRLSRRAATWSLFILCGLIFSLAVALGPIRAYCISLPVAARLGLSAAVIALPGLLMGVPLARLLLELKQRRVHLLPWAWALNGFASVLSALLASVLAIVLGFAWVIGLAGLAYMAAGWLYYCIGIGYKTT